MMLRDLKILLLQIREDEETMLEEYYEFVQYGQLRESQIDKLNTYETTFFEPEVIDGYDALFIGGSSDASVLNEEEFRFVKDCKRLIRYCYDKNKPVLASCFGFQILVEELGGTIILDKKNMEMGLYQIQLMPQAKEDPLLFDYPEYFWAVSGHKERAQTIPKNSVLLGSSSLCPFHLIKIKEKPIYGFQFHPEVNKEDLVTRIIRYQNRYLDNNEALQEIIDNAVHETTFANKLIYDFIERVILVKQPSLSPKIREVL